MTNAIAVPRRHPMKKSTTTLFCAILAASGLQAQIVINQTLTPEQLVQDVLLGSGVQVSNITFNGLPGTTLTEQAGSFDGTNRNVGIEQGIMISTGSVLNAIGPNNTGSVFTLENTGQSDPDLISIGNSVTDRKSVV